MFSVEPAHHWKPGDKAYCLATFRHESGRRFEKGRVYEVLVTQAHAGMMNDRVLFRDMPRESVVNSNCFACLRGKGPYMKQLAQRTTFSWSESYKESANARAIAENRAAPWP